MVFIDSNIPMYVAGRDHPNREPARRLMEAVRAGTQEACTSTEVLQEILYRYSGLRCIALMERVYDLFAQICPTVLPVALADTDRAKSLLVKVPGISARDAVHAAVMLNHGIDLVATFDEGFDRIPGIGRYRLS
jgi:predicted nucleic acid-binding protein